MNNKEIYVKPEISVNLFDKNDKITTSYIFADEGFGDIIEWE